jgi:hypothetical protein
VAIFWIVPTAHDPTFAAGSAVLDQLRAEARLEQLQVPSDDESERYEGITNPQSRRSAIDLAK